MLRVLPAKFQFIEQTTKEQNMKKQNNRLHFLPLILLLGILLSSFTSCDAFDGLISGDGGFDPWDEKYFENQDDDFYDKYAVVTDSLGRTAAVERNPICVAALTGGLAEVWMLSGGEVFATVDDAWTDMDLNLRSDAVNLGGTHSIDMEALYELNPELVIASAHDPNREELMQAFDSKGILVLFFDISSYDDYLYTLKVCTDITGRSGFYETYGLDMKDQIDTCRALAYENGSAPRVLLLRASKSGLQVKNSNGTVLGETLEDLGCINIADIDQTLTENLDLENIQALQPDLIFIFIMGDDIDGAFLKMSEVIGDSPVWSQLDAVKAEKVFYMDKILFTMKPNTRWPDVYGYLTDILLNCV